MGTVSRRAEQLSVGPGVKWHWHGILLWLIQRPYLRFLPPPLPSVTTVSAWQEQVNAMVERFAWPSAWHRRIDIGNLCTIFHLKECAHLRDRMGLLLAFMEDDANTFGLVALKRQPRKKLQEAAAQETMRLLQLSREERTQQLRALLGPRGGLPRLKDELVKAAA